MIKIIFILIILKILSIVVSTLIAVAYFTIAEKQIVNVIQRNVVGYLSILMSLGHFSFQTPTPNFYKILIVFHKKNLSFKALEF